MASLTQMGPDNWLWPPVSPILSVYLLPHPPSIYLLANLCIHLYIHLHTHPPTIHPSAHLFISLSTHLPALPISRSVICPSIYASFIHSPNYPSIHLPISSSVHSFIHPFTHPPHFSFILTLISSSHPPTIYASFPAIYPLYFPNALSVHL